MAVLEGEDLERAAAALEGDRAAPVTEVWPEAKVLRGHVQAAGPITNSAQCPRRGEEDNGLVFVHVCGGSFQMGSAADDTEAYEGEKPAHRVTVSSFWIGKYEVSNAEYRKVYPGHAPDEDGTLPATNVLWNDAKKFCTTLGHRLPTEAEWEYAARGPEGRRYPWGGDKPTEKLAVFGEAKPAPAKSFAGVRSDRHAAGPEQIERAFRLVGLSRRGGDHPVSGPSTPEEQKS